MRRESVNLTNTLYLASCLLFSTRGCCQRGRRNTTLLIDEIFITQNVGKQKAMSMLWKCTSCPIFSQWARVNRLIVLQLYVLEVDAAVHKEQYTLYPTTKCYLCSFVRCLRCCAVYKEYKWKACSTALNSHYWTTGAEPEVVSSQGSNRP